MKEPGNRVLHHNGQSATHVADEAAGYPLSGELILIGFERVASLIYVVWLGQV